MSEIKITVGEGLSSVLDRAAEAERAWRAGERAADVATHLNFENWELLTAVLTPRRLELLRHLHRAPASSVRSLASTLNRAYANVHADVAALTEAGLIERDARGIRAGYDEITTRIAL